MLITIAVKTTRGRAPILNNGQEQHPDKMPVNPRNKEGVIKVEIYKSIYDRVSEHAAQRSITIKDYINKVMESHLAAMDFFKQRFAQISEVGATETAVLIEDKGKKAIASITLQKDGNMYCSVCKSNFCEHIFASIMSPSWLKILERMTKE